MIEDDQDELFCRFGASIAPQRDLWPQVLDRIAARRRRAWMRTLAIAASVAALVLGGVAVRMHRTEHPPLPRPLIPNPVVAHAEQQYLNAFKLLRVEQAANQAAVDDQSLAEIDSRIATTRAAVVAAPNDALVVARWRAACDRKIALLRAAVESRS